MLKKIFLGLILFIPTTGFLLLGFGVFSDAWDDFFVSQNRVVFLDVGQGDGILLQTSARENILTDGGPDNSVIYQLGKFIPFWDREIDLLVVTHPDADHVTGLVEVLRRYKVKKVLATGVTHTLPAYSEFINEINQKNIPIVKPVDIDNLSFTDLNLRILWPKEDLWAQDFGGELNDTSIVIKATFNNKDSIMLTGDLTEEKETELIKIYGSELKSNILKAGHHGSKTSTSRDFLKFVGPTQAIISAARDNYYGHPHFKVIKNLLDSNIEILQTANLGSIELNF